MCLSLSNDSFPAIVIDIVSCVRDYKADFLSYIVMA